MLPRRFLVLIFLLTLPAAPAPAASDEAAVRATIADWYAELRKGKGARPWNFLAPNAEVLPSECPDRCGPQPRALKFPRPLYPRHLVRRAQKFEYDIEKMTVERTLARVDVWERGWTYAWALKKTTVAAADAWFILVKRDGEWKILVYSSERRALRPKDREAPMPDLSNVPLSPFAPKD